MAISTESVKKLRELSGAGIVDCKNALKETEGDITKAVEYLRKKGLAAAAKKAGRIAADGIVVVLTDDAKTKGVVVEVNCETDFVAKNPDFKKFVEQVGEQALNSDNTAIEDFLNEKWAFDETLSVADALSEKISIIGEKLSIRRFAKIFAKENGLFANYIHGGGKMGVLLEFGCAVDNDDVAEMGKNVCMQIAAMYPKYICRDEIPQDFLDNERAIVKAQSLIDPRIEGKPDAVVEKMIDGKLNKSLKEICLLEQTYVKDDKISVKQYIDSVAKAVGSPIELRQFVSYERGEGIEKKEENFAEEVSKAMNV